MKLAFFETPNGLAPRNGGPLVAPVTIPLSTDNPYSLDLVKEHEAKPEQFVQTLFVDNSQNDGELLITTGILSQPIRVPANSQGYFQILFPTSGALAFQSSATSPVDIYVALINVPMPLGFWGPGVGGSGNISDLIALQRGSYADYSGTITTGGSSQQVLAANTSRKRILIQTPLANNGTPENIYINFGGAASAGGDSFEISPGGAYDSGAFPVPTNLVEIFAATTGTIFVVKEMT